MKKLALIGVLASAMTFGANASVITYDDGVNSFDFDQMQVTGLGYSTITQTDTNGDGTLIGPDDFVEFGLTAAIGFTNNGFPVFGTGLNAAFQLIFDISLQGSATANAGVDGIPGTADDQLVANFNSLSSAELWRSTTINNTLVKVGPGADTKIGNLTMGSGECLVTTASETGKCDLSFNFDSLVAGLFSTPGGDLQSEPYVGIDFTMTIVDIINGFQFVYPNGPGTTQTMQVQHTGDASINVPEPTTIAILGLGLLGLAGARRRKS